jgi:hypothetical protein
MNKSEERRQVPIMATTVRETIRELIASMQETLDVLLEVGDIELPQPSSHVCAQGRDVWALITNDIDHEKIHAGQVAEGRYENRITASPMDRLIAEWLQERARLIGGLIGLTDEQFNGETAPGAWTYRQVIDHARLVEQDSMRVILADRERRE